LEPSPGYCCHFSWPVWPVFVDLKISLIHQVVITAFLVKCSYWEWDNIFFIIEVVGSIQRTDPIPLQGLFLWIIADTVSEQQDPKLAFRFVDLFINLLSFVIKAFLQMDFY
jgi:hypothetical protein